MSNKLKIVQLNTVDIRGGAAKVAYRLHKGLLKRGFSSSMIVGRKHSTEKEIYSFRKDKWTEKVYNKFLIFFEELFGLQYFFHASISKLIKLKEFNEADIIHVHNLHGSYINFFILKHLAKQKHIVYTIHDMWPITGHCSHSNSCEGWMYNCGSCPHLKYYPGLKIDSSSFLLHLKEKIYQEIKNKIVITVPSVWLINKINRSIMKNLELKKINNFADITIFEPIEKGIVRLKYNISMDSFVICFTGGANNSHNKGYSKLIDSIKLIKKSSYDIILLTIGGNTNYEFTISGIKGKNISFRENERELAELYSLSDIYVLASAAENSPLVVIESLACGLPIVAFNVGGVSEIVAHMENGYLAEPQDIKSLSEGILHFVNLTHEDRLKFREKARKSVEKAFSENMIIEQYISLYKDILGRN